MKILAKLALIAAAVLPEFPLAAGEFRLAYDRDGAVWLAGADGGGAKRLAAGGMPALRPDGLAVAYLRGGREGGSAADPVSLFVMDLETKREVKIATDTFVEGPVWSPDGRSLAFVRYQEPDAGNALCVIDANGKNLRLVPLKNDRTMGTIWSLEWLPDGSGLGFHDMTHYWQVSAGGEVLRKMVIPDFAGEKNPDGRERHSLASSDSVAICPKDAKLLAYTEDVQGSPAFQDALHGEPISAILLGRIGVMPAARRVTDKTVMVMDVVWAPDGASLYFTGYRDSQAKEKHPFRVFRINRDGSHLTEIGRGEHPSVAATK